MLASSEASDLEIALMMNAPMRVEYGHPAGARRPGALLAVVRLVIVAAVPMAGYAYSVPVRPIASATARSDQGDVVAVLPFRVTSASQPLRDLRDAIQDLLADGLDVEGAAPVLNPREVLLPLRSWRAPTRDGLSPDAVHEIVRRIGTPRVVLGEIGGTPEQLVVEATVISVGDGAAKAHARVEGTADRLPSLTDQLAIQLLATQAARDSAELAALRATSLPAVRAYFAGRHAYRRGRLGANSEAVEHFRRALFLDSTFALAGLRLAEIAVRFGMAERDEQWKLAAIWRQRDRLGPADRALLEAYLGPRYPHPATLAELVRAAERATRVAPHRAEAWHIAGVGFLRFGPRIGYPRWEARAVDAFRRALALDSTEVFPLQYLVLLSALTGDTAGMRRYADRHRAYKSVGGQQTDFIYWVAAVTLGDTAELTRLRARFPEMTSVSLQSIIEWSENLALGLDDADRAARAFDQASNTAAQRRSAIMRLVPFMLNRGRPREASRLLGTSERGFGQAVDVGVLEFRIYSALYWDGDSSDAAFAVRSLEAHLDGEAMAPGQVRDHQTAACAVAHWRLAIGDLPGADAALERMHRLVTAAGPVSKGSTALCAAAAEAQLAAARRQSDAAAALERLDALLAAGSDVQHVFPTVATIIAARLYEARGDLQHALALTRRRTFWWNWLLSTPLREEGRLAALVGDTAGAIRAYRNYLSLRSDPEPRLRPEVDRVRAKLARLNRAL